jgi:hypothetical protein
LSTLRILGKGDFHSEVADIHNIPPSMSQILMDVVDAIDCSLHNINFPSDASDILHIKEKFASVANFPNVVRSIDGTLIPIIGMSGDDEQVFVCRKSFHAVNVQGVVTAHLPDAHFV